MLSFPHSNGGYLQLNYGENLECLLEGLQNIFRYIGGVPTEIVKSKIVCKLKILSRGTLPPGQTIDGFFAGESVPVNQELSDLFLQLHISERTGRGVPKIVEVYGKEVYEFRENSIVVTILFDAISTEASDLSTDAQVTTPVTTPVSKNIGDEYYTEISEKILSFCMTPKGILEIAQYLGFKEKKSARKYIKPLVEQGRLAMTVPDKPNSRFQKYITVK